MTADGESHFGAQSYTYIRVHTRQEASVRHGAPVRGKCQAGLGQETESTSFQPG